MSTSEREQDRSLLEELRQELEDLLADHPDVLARLLGDDDEVVERSYLWDFPKEPSNEITDRIWCGGDDYLFDHRENAHLVDVGITHVLDCRSEAASDHTWRGVSHITLAHRKAPFVYLLNGTGDDGRRKSVEYFRRSIDFGLKALADPNAKIYVHCAAGINRGPSSCYAIMRASGMSRAQAEHLLHQKRPGVGIAYLEDAELALKALGYK